MSEEDEFLTTAEVGQRVRAAAETVRFWRHQKKGPAYFKIGRKVLYRRRDVEEWLAAQRTATTTTPGGGGRPA